MDNNQDVSKEDAMSENKTDYRWWEFYLVRYLIGTILGTVIVSYIAFHNVNVRESLITNTKADTYYELLKANYWIFLIVGFAYCYLSSAPILVFHALRGYLKSTNGKLNDFTKVFGIICFFGTILFLILTLCCDIKASFKWIRWVILFVVILPQAIFLLRFLLDNNVFNFYKKLTENRRTEKKSDARHEYVESYKHLREHGNAFSILITEFVLSFILIELSISEIVSVLIIWVLPASYVWLIGTNLEFGLGELD